MALFRFSDASLSHKRLWTYSSPNFLASGTPFVVVEGSCARPHWSHHRVSPEAAVMICVTVTQHSRRLALASLLNAARMSADLVEVRLDTFGQLPDLAELLAARRTPILFSCRRPQDGG